MHKTRARARTIAVAMLCGCVLPGGVGAQTPSPPQVMAAGQNDQKTEVGQTPTVGQKAPDFTLMAIDGTRVRLSDELARGPVALVVLRGFPTYQCPFCTRQFADYLAHGDDFQASGAQVLFVYPGPAEGLNDHARALMAGRPLPPNYRILMDPDYEFTKAYDLRWDAPKETAYPSTMVIDKNGRVAFARISRAHGDRVPTADVLNALTALPR